MRILLILGFPIPVWLELLRHHSRGKEEDRDDNAADRVPNDGRF